MLAQLGSDKLTVETVGYELGEVWCFPINEIPSFYAVNSYDVPQHPGAVGPVVYALNEYSQLSSLVLRCRFGDLIIHCRQFV